MAASDPDAINMTMQVTMSLKEWKELRKLMDDDNEYWSTASTFSSAVKELIDHAQKHFCVLDTSQ
jgi:hypothetical protein